MTASAIVGPTADAERALGPDLARGVMLLCIALANTHYFLTGEQSPVALELGLGPDVFAGFPRDLGPVDGVTAWFISTFVDERSFPMFGVLFGYGVARIAARRAGAPRKAIRRLLWRRSAVLIAVGAVHGLLLFVGDILAGYGVLLLVGAWTVGWKDRTLLVVATCFFVYIALPDPQSLVYNLTYDSSMLSPSLVEQVRERIEVTPWIAGFAPVAFACPFLVGVWAGRRRVLERPAEHHRLLVATAVVGITVAVIGAQPVALAVAGLVDLPSQDAMRWVGPLHSASGNLGGFGYAALIALIAQHLGQDRGPRFPAGQGTAPPVEGGWPTPEPSPAAPHPFVRALAATGQRSMTCYLLQSVVWFVVFTPYLFGLADELSVTATALLATMTWGGTVLLADRMRADGRRGPFETLTRRVTYGKATGPSAPQPGSEPGPPHRPSAIGP